MFSERCCRGSRKMAHLGICNTCKDNFIVNGKYIECTFCKSIYHNTCVKIKDVISKAVMDLGNIMWFCDACIKTVAQNLNLIKKIEAMDAKADTVIKQTAECIRSISEGMKTHDSVNTSDKQERNYAKVLKEGVVIVKPTKECDSKETKKHLQQNLNRISLSAGITGIREAKRGAVIVTCRDNKDAAKLKSNMENSLGQQYNISVPIKRKPCIKIVGIENQYSEQELLKILKSQNSEVFSENSEVKIIAYKKMVKTYLAILQCDPGTFKRIQHEADFRLCIGLKACRCFEYVNVHRCYNCNKYGHFSSECAESRSCAKCCSDTHETKECSSQILTCINCKASNEKYNLDLNTNHSVYSMSCPTYNRIIQLEKLKIQYDFTE